MSAFPPSDPATWRANPSSIPQMTDAVPTRQDFRDMMAGILNADSSQEEDARWDQFDAAIDRLLATARKGVEALAALRARAVAGTPIGWRDFDAIVAEAGVTPTRSGQSPNHLNNQEK